MSTFQLVKLGFVAMPPQLSSPICAVPANELYKLANSLSDRPRLFAFTKSRIATTNAYRPQHLELLYYVYC
jgi:hypothetical protein